MNEERNKRFLEMITVLQSMADELSDICEEEQSRFDAMTESEQQSENGAELEAFADEMDEAATLLDEVVSIIGGYAE